MGKTAPPKSTIRQGWLWLGQNGIMKRTGEMMYGSRRTRHARNKEKVSAKRREENARKKVNQSVESLRPKVSPGSLRAGIEIKSPRKNLRLNLNATKYT